MKSKPVPVAGIDVSKEFSDMCILSPDNAVFEKVKIYHDKASISAMVGMLGIKNMREQCFLTAAVQNIKRLVASLLFALSYNKPCILR